VIALLAAAMLAVVFAQRLSPASAASAAVDSTWQLARLSGGYTFSADIIQKTVPLPTLGNIGRSSKEYAYFVQGSTDFEDQSLEMALWSGGGSVQDDGSASRFKVEGDQAFTQRDDQTWEEISDFTGAFAPGGDFLGFLSAARNVREEAPAPHHHHRPGLGKLPAARPGLEGHPGFDRDPGVVYHLDRS
jgi:hypothetical protein